MGSNYEISIGDTANLIAEVMNVEIEIETENERLRPEKSEVFRLWCENAKAKKIWTAILERADKMAKKKIKKDQMGFPIPEKDKTVTVGAMI